MIAPAQAGRTLYRQNPSLHGALAARKPERPAPVATAAGLARPRLAVVTLARPIVARVMPRSAVAMADALTHGRPVPELTTQQIAEVLRFAVDGMTGIHHDTPARRPARRPTSGPAIKPFFP